MKKFTGVRAWGLILLRYSGMSSSQLSMMNTLLTYSLMLFFFFLFSKRSKGARRGMKSRALNSSCPSTEKCCGRQRKWVCWTLLQNYLKATMLKTYKRTHKTHGSRIFIKKNLNYLIQLRPLCNPLLPETSFPLLAAQRLSLKDFDLSYWSRYCTLTARWSSQSLVRLL